MKLINVMCSIFTEARILYKPEAHRAAAETSKSCTRSARPAAARDQEAQEEILLQKLCH